MENKEMLTGNNRDLFHPESILGYKMLGELWMVMVLGSRNPKW